jgi:hypothetical protein
MASAFTTLDGGGAVNRSRCFSIFSLSSAPYAPTRQRVSYHVRSRRKGDIPSLLFRSKSIRAAKTHLAPTVRCSVSWCSEGVLWMSSDWYTKPVCRLCVTLENPAAIFLCAPRSYNNMHLRTGISRERNWDLTWTLQAGILASALKPPATPSNLAAVVVPTIADKFGARTFIRELTYMKI